MKARKIILNVTAPPCSNDELVQVLAFHVTGGDPAGYLARLADKEAAEKEASSKNSPIAPKCNTN